MALNRTSQNVEFFDCSTEISFVCEVKQGLNHERIYRMGWPDYVYPLDKLKDNAVESLVGFSDQSIRVTNLASAANFAENEKSYLIDSITFPAYDSFIGFTIGFWVNIRSGTKIQNVLDLENILQVSMHDQTLAIDTCYNEENDCSLIKSFKNITLSEWHFIGIVYNHKLNVLNLYIDEQFGYENSEGESIKVKLRGIDRANFSIPLQLILGNAADNKKPLNGKLSCLQIFFKPLSKSEVNQLSKVCYLQPEYKRSKECQEGSVQLENMCYTLSETPKSYAEAEMECLHNSNQTNVTKLAFTASYQQQLILLELAEKRKDITELYLGIDAYSGNIISRFIPQGYELVS